MKSRYRKHREGVLNTLKFVVGPLLDRTILVLVKHYERAYAQAEFSEAVPEPTVRRLGKEVLTHVHLPH